ncbi:hypothetical protein EV127DRAFT_414258 [Xylaria flabelliformis]|nr:hypothetical protein EV127DRAFT_414258 [Xylaria flabelliformis]
MVKRRSRLPPPQVAYMEEADDDGHVLSGTEAQYARPPGASTRSPVTGVHKILDPAEQDRTQPTPLLKHVTISRDNTANRNERKSASFAYLGSRLRSCHNTSSKITTIRKTLPSRASLGTISTETVMPYIAHSSPRDLLPPQRGLDKPDSNSVSNQLVLDEDPMDGSRVLRKRRASSAEVDEDAISQRKRAGQGTTSTETKDLIPHVVRSSQPKGRPSPKKPKSNSLEHRPAQRAHVEEVAKYRSIVVYYCGFSGEHKLHSDDKNNGNVFITKTGYRRPKQPEVFCDQYDEHKEGFRGEHELRRHKDARHQTRIKTFICVDPRKYGLPHNIRVVNPLFNCKACIAQKKYGAYYNAAAHLRRSHFRERFSRERKNSGANGGKGGGNWPPMQEMKNWMQEIWVLQGEPDRHNYNDQINRYDKLNKGDVGYGGNEFSGHTNRNPAVTESLLSQRLRSL